MSLIWAFIKHVFVVLLTIVLGQVISGGVLGGHDYAASRPGVVRAVHAFAHQRRLAIELTDVQRPRNDVIGRPIPPCCPSWYFIKP
jgi:hypothetical protein